MRSTSRRMRTSVRCSLAMWRDVMRYRARRRMCMSRIALVIRSRCMASRIRRMRIVMS